MSVDAALQTALSTLGLPVFPNKYTGADLEYLVTNWVMLPAASAGDKARAARYLVTVGYYLPDKKNPNPVLEAICLALAGHRFTCPQITPAHSDHGQHYAVECEYCDGGVNYGPCHA